jgi:hypothetical protein
MYCFYDMHSIDEMSQFGRITGGLLQWQGRATGTKHPQLYSRILIQFRAETLRIGTFVKYTPQLHSTKHLRFIQSHQGVCMTSIVLHAVTYRASLAKVSRGKTVNSRPRCFADFDMPTASCCLIFARRALFSCQLHPQICMSHSLFRGLSLQSLNIVSSLPHCSPLLYERSIGIPFC